jgi:pimeloyl-ACP methyl ester carboxylesterase
MTGDLDWEQFLANEAQVRFVTVGEHQLRVIEMGKGEPVLLVHGFADSARTWSRNFGPLAEAGFRVLAYDHPGCGESALPPGFRFGVDNLAELAVGLLDALGVERAHLVGHSMGGGIGLQLAVHQPDRLRRAVLAAPVCYHVPLPLANPWRIWPILRSRDDNLAPLTTRVQAQCQSLIQRPEYLRACTGLVRDYWNHAFFATARRYREISSPIHLIWGEQDIGIPPRRYALRLAADTGASLSVVAGTGHLVQQSRPKLFNEIVTHFLVARE